MHHHYIRARSHTRLNGTRWETLDEFAQYLGKTGKAEVEQTAHGFSVIYRDKDPDLVAKQEKKLREKQIDQEDQLIQSWIDNHKSDSNAKEAPAPTEIDLNEAKNIKFEFKQPLKKSTNPLISPTTIPPTTSPSSTTTIESNNKPDLDTSAKKEEEVIFISNFSSGSSTSSSKSNSNNLQATKPLVVNNKDRDNEVENKKRKASSESETSKYLYDENEMKKKRMYRKSSWLQKGIIVKIINKQLGNGKYYKQKGVVEEVLGGGVALIKMIDMNDKLKMDQSQLETVIPNIGGKIMIVNGMYQGSTGILTAINEAKYSVQIKITSGDNEGRVTWEEYEDVSKIN